MNSIISRPYHPGDLDACLAILDGNVPRFFAPTEREEFHDFLCGLDKGAADSSYMVLTRAGQMVACGGLTIGPEAGQAHLAWGMVHRAHHRRGIGTRLVQERLELVRRTPGIGKLVLATSQRSGGFYLALGFTVINVIPNGFHHGLDRWDMSLQIAQGREADL